MSALSKNRNLAIIALIAIVNALGYGIIIPILYIYSRKHGLSDFQNGLLFATFSFFQFLSTPIIGRLSDKYGRRPLLIYSLSGTVVAFFMMAFAPSAIFLFVARAIDGITAGNFSVASAVVSDTTDKTDRAKGFGIIGAAFGFGFIFGPAISALTVGISDSLPFIIAGLIALVSVIMTIIFLPETNKHIGQVVHKKLFDFSKMFEALTYENVGITLWITLFYFLAFTLFIYAFQPYSVKVLNLNPTRISFIFTVFGIVGVIGQMIFVSRVTKLFGQKTAFTGSIFVVFLSFLLMFLSKGFWAFVAVCIVLALSNSIVQPLMSTILSEEIDDKSQGSILGIQSSYMSMGQILGPIAGGGLATISIPFPFIGGTLLAFICFLLSFKVLKRGVPKESAF